MGSRDQRNKIMREVRGHSHQPPRALVMLPHETRDPGREGTRPLPSPPASALGSCHLWPENSPQTRRCLKIDPSGGKAGEGEH